MPPPPPARAVRWLSRDIGALIRSQAADPVAYDLVIVGSGYGGAMAAAELAGCQVPDEASPGGRRPARVCVLERGQEYLPGAFPSRMADLPRSVRIKTADNEPPKGEPEALFDVRMGKDVAVLLANGLGGGSLINGAVMEKPKFGSFTSHLPPGVEADLRNGLLDEAKARLGALVDGQNNTIERHASHRQTPAQPLPKTEALKALDPDHFRPAALTIEMQGGANAQGVQLNACSLCGDCMTGCNVGAKASLDTNLLVQAWQQGAEIYTDASVLRVEREQGLWALVVVPTPLPLRAREQAQHSEAHGDAGALRLRAHKVILAAGALGSTEILLRSQHHGLALSSRLGQRFSGNGDNMTALHKTVRPVHTVADETTPFDARRVGPTITGIVDARAADGSHGFLIQEFAVPAPLKRLFEEIVTTTEALHRLPEADLSCHRPGQPASRDPAAIDPEAMVHTALLGLIGHDSASGVVRLAKGLAQGKASQEGMATIDWPDARWSGHLEQAQARLAQLAAGQLAPGGRVLPNPVWRMLPPGLEFLARQGRGPVLTVHPLGGCAMGRHAGEGVVDELGRVFDGQAGLATDPNATPAVFDSSLLVLDGAVLPGSLGANPALTIAAIALRSARHLRQVWGWQAPAAAGALSAPAPRPVVRTPAQSFSEHRVATELQIVERLSGAVTLRTAAGAAADHIAELTLHYQPQTLAQLTETMGRTIPLQAQAGQANTLRLFRKTDWEQGLLQPDGTRGMPLRLLDEDQRTAQAVLVATVDGQLRLLDRKATTVCGRVLRGLYAWFFNRGLRDLWQEKTDRPALAPDHARQPPAAAWPVSAARQLVGIVRVASRAGEQRVFDYRLHITGVLPGAQDGLAQRIRPGDSLHGEKCLTYARRANPWKQLSRMRLLAFPGLSRPGLWWTPRTLALDLRFMACEGVPLLQITRQQDQPSALADMASLSLYMLRLVLSTHLWSFRKPDLGPERTPQPLPGYLPGLPPPEITELDLDRLANGKPVRVRLTRYPRPDSRRPPLVFIHGYSASGTNFAHPAIRPCLASHFWQQGCDIWVLDLRTSSGMPTASHAWDFEDAAFADIPMAIAHIVAATGQPQVDVFAHCIGAIMLSMALLSDGEAAQALQSKQPAAKGERLPRICPAELDALPGRVNAVVLSQKGPVLNYTDANVFRAHVMQHLRRLLLPDRYRFRPAGQPTVKDQLMDRLFATMPYPDEEFDRENPPPWRFWQRTPWTATRHRMDALYARDFNVNNIADETLVCIDDFFGALNLDTVSQAIYFARDSTITNGDGCRVPLDALAARWRAIPTLSLHGAANGLVDVATLGSMATLMANAGVPFQTLQVDGHGHQDCLIGRYAAQQVFAPVDAFLRQSLPRTRP